MGSHVPWVETGFSRLRSFMTVLFALAAAVALTSGQICVRLGLQYGSPTTAVTCAIFTMTPVVLAILGPSASWESYSVPGVIWFMLAGVVSPMATQLLLFASTLKVGIARTSPLRNTSPLFASLLAISFLGEAWSYPIAIGTFSVIAGATLLGTDRGKAGSDYKRRYLWLAVASGVLGGFSDPIRKFGFTLIPDFPLAMCLLAMGSLLAMAVYLAAGRYKELTLNRPAIKWFVLSGIATALGVTLSLLATNLGRVVVVTPLISTVPLFTLLLSLVFLRKFEAITVQVICGTVMICFGGALLGVYG